MDIKGTTEPNRLIAEFMEDEFNSNGDQVYPKGIYGCGGCYNIESLRYGSSWDWLMPAISKFNELDHGQEMGFQYHIYRANVSSAVTTYNIEEAHKVFVNALIWYNTQASPEINL